MIGKWKRISVGAAILIAIGLVAHRLVFDAGPIAFADPKIEPGSYPITNRLINEKSPYLLQHAHNPVDWYPWGAEAFAKAKSENKPIFLSIGYSTCHWCHVMERESFTNPQIAKLINDDFVAIKVDREERPDIDAVYMNFVVATTGSGGWPMTVFLTPDRQPFFGGTYFPPEAKDGELGLKELLPRIHDAWANHRDKLVASAAKAAEALKAAASATPDAGDPLTPAILDRAVHRFQTEFDAAHPGFGQAPKFPRPVALNFLLREHYRTGNKAALDMVLANLRAMADGGIHDQIGGGFHRYSTDARWFLPHFEKMLYDQAQLASSYLDAYQITQDALYADAARDILDYVLRDMTGPGGEFYSAEDADSALDAADPAKKGEGAFYVWRAAEIRDAIGDAAAAVFDYRYGVEEHGNVEADPRQEFVGKNVLHVAHTIEECAAKFAKPADDIARILAGARQKLLQVRSARPRPARDDKTLTAWNGLMISAFARAGMILNKPSYLAAAVKSAEFIESHLYNAGSGELTRRWRDGQAEVPGFLEDYAFFTQAAIDLYQASMNVHWLKLALDLQQKQTQLFADPGAGGFFKTAGDDPTILARPKEAEDEAEPSGNSIAAMNLLRLGRMMDDQNLVNGGETTIRAFSSMLAQTPSAFPQMLSAYDFSAAKPLQVVIAAKPGAADAQAMLLEIYNRYLPDKVILSADGGAGQEFLAHHIDLFKSIAMVQGRATAYVCRNFACQLPTNDLAVLRKLLGHGKAIQ